MTSGLGSELSCPACSGPDLSISTVTVDIPYFGEVLLSTVLCSNCGFRSTDVQPVGAREPARYTLKVASPTDLGARVVRSSTSTLSIPELCLLVEPGRAMDGYVTNVEGVLRRLLDVVNTMENGLEDDIKRRKRAKGISDTLGRMISGDFSKGDVLTLILEDPMGNGLLASPDGRVVREPLNGAGEERTK